MKSLLEMHNREEAIERLKVLYSRGYRYVAREPDSDFLIMFTLKPKKYFKDYVGWGYRNSDLNHPDVRYADVFKNVDMTEIKWTNRYPTLIADLIEV